MASDGNRTFTARRRQKGSTLGSSRRFKAITAAVAIAAAVLPLAPFVKVWADGAANDQAEGVFKQHEVADTVSPAASVSTCLITGLSARLRRMIPMGASSDIGVWVSMLRKGQIATLNSVKTSTAPTSMAGRGRRRGRALVLSKTRWERMAIRISPLVGTTASLERKRRTNLSTTCSTAPASMASAPI